MTTFGSVRRAEMDLLGLAALRALVWDGWWG